MTNYQKNDPRESVDNFFGSHNQTKRHQLFYAADQHCQEEEKSDPNSEEMLAMTIKANPNWDMYASTLQQHYLDAPPP
jgi:hypothetical protein